MKLGILIYDLLQKYINKDFSDNFEFFNSRINWGPSSNIVDLGCGTGLIAQQFRKSGLSYTGIDMDLDRIESARRSYPEFTFFCNDLNQISKAELPSIDFVIMHGVVHHLSDFECANLLTTLQERGCKQVGFMDPIKPKSWIKNPLGAYLAFLDEGHYVRSSEDYKFLLEQFGHLDFHIQKNPRWPVPIGLSVLTF
jgi:2-polyprenyl-3-methyl-5-hydroxy-6-metoxy-1,4-benzoquinol methylase